MFSFLNKLEVCYCTNIARCPTETVSGLPFMTKYLIASFLLRLHKHSGILNGNAFIQNTKILLQWPEISYNDIRA